MDTEGRVLDELESRDAIKKMSGDSRTYRVRLDTNQYKLDADKGQEVSFMYIRNAGIIYS
jgi:hypothetical protein